MTSYQQSRLSLGIGEQVIGLFGFVIDISEQARLLLAFTFSSSLQGLKDK